MVLLLCFSATLWAEAPAVDSGEASVKLREAEMARQAAEKRCTELSLVLVQTERELEKERQRFADLYLKCQALQDGHDQLQMRVVSLLLDEADVAPGQALANLVSGLDERQAEIQRLTVKVREFGRYLPPVLDTLQPSETLRQEVLGRCTELTRASDRLEALPPIVAGRGGETGAPRPCRVLTVNPDLGIVVLDAGSAAGVRLGSSWKIVDGGKVTARLRVIELRGSLGAATVLEGRLKRLTPGMPVVPGE
jgi:hypothetical protein